MWKSKNGKVWHRFNDCSCITSNAYKITDNHARTLSQCKRCINKSLCDICMVDSARVPLCNLHVACYTCFENSVNKSYECPFDGNQLVDIPFKFLNRRDTSSRYICPIEYTIENILTLKCPNCKKAFYDFEACLLLRCNNCSKSFCGLCFEIIQNHEHLLVCPYRTSRCDGYFMNFEEWQKFHDQKKTEKIIEIRKKLYSKSIFLAFVYQLEMMRFHNILYHHHIFIRISKIIKNISEYFSR